MTSTGAALSAVSKRYSHRGPRVLDEVELVFSPGSRTALIGENGSGKSTLARIVAGVSKPTSGTVDLPPRIGYVPERQAERINLTGYEYVSHMGRIRGLDGNLVDRRARELFERMDLLPGARVTYGSLSKGNRQKVMLAQAFLEPVDLLVLDEPLSGLDSKAVQALGELLHEAHACGTAILTTGHESSCDTGMDRVMRIESGLLVETPMATTASQGRRDRRIHLTVTPGAHPVEVISNLPGIRRIQADGSGLSLWLVADGDHADTVLSQAIRLGWSVSLVSDVPDGDWLT